MKKSIIFMVCVLCSLSQALLARSFMPRLDRLKNKVELALTSAPKESFKSILERVQNVSDVDNRGVQSIGQLAVCAGSYIIESHASADAQQSKLQEIQKKLSDLYWCNQHDLINQIDAVRSESSSKVLVVFKEHLSKKFPTHKAPLIAFAAEVQKEEVELQKCTTDLMRLMEKKTDQQKADEELPKKIQIELNKIIQLKGMLEKLLAMVNTILMNES